MKTELVLYPEQLPIFCRAAEICGVDVISSKFIEKDGKEEYHIVTITHSLRSNLFAIGIVVGEMMSKQIHEN